MTAGFAQSLHLCAYHHGANPRGSSGFSAYCVHGYDGSSFCLRGREHAGCLKAQGGVEGLRSLIIVCPRAYLRAEGLRSLIIVCPRAYLWAEGLRSLIVEGLSFLSLICTAFPFCGGAAYHPFTGPDWPVREGTSFR